jgi:hypothetical protein
MDKDKKQKPTQLELNYDARVANIPSSTVKSRSQCGISGRVCVGEWF